MPVRFTKSTKNIHFLDPRKEFQHTQASFEFRFDPLTRKRSRVTNLKFRFVHPPDLQSIIEKSAKRPCPFCRGNVDDMTPKFIPEFAPEGRISIGDALVFPNSMPYDQHNALAIFSRDHFVSLTQFSESLLFNGFLAAQAFFNHVAEKNSRCKYFCINWNYMPPSGGSLIHPHLHLMADKEPSDHHRLLMQRGKRYYKKFGINYWDDLIEEERRRKVRYIGETGSVCWLVYFAPKGMMFDVMGIFRKNLSILDLTRQQVRDFSQGLQKIFSYLEQKNLYSFNLALYSGIKEKEYFWTHVRLIPRFTIPPVDTSDVSFTSLLHEESLATLRPEDVCWEIRESW
ncbi:MAG TPA: hypothetical protein PLG17_00685 [Thermodesulfobacteriota bacterium]|nr:hypothetical protein [Deltaproteobacteria bacterium]HNR11837.1 hypothetical protein [Thermodesulfobacteriota bacterium]HNU70108.1 hypothetical protein [Thermodesulfobacteriota bacterium]HQO77006.1 hypothetical protein [Thermodesulfobacteriota bacterium]